MLSIHHLHSLGCETDLPAYIFRDTLALIGEINITGCDPPPCSAVAYITQDEDWPLAAASRPGPARPTHPPARLSSPWKSVAPSAIREQWEISCTGADPENVNRAGAEVAKMQRLCPETPICLHITKILCKRVVAKVVRTEAPRREQIATTTDSYWLGSGMKNSKWLNFCANHFNIRPRNDARSDICILQSACPAFVMMSSLLNSHESGLCKVFSGYKLPCTTYVLFSPNLLPVASRAEQAEPVDTERHLRMWLPKRAQKGTCA